MLNFKSSCYELSLEDLSKKIVDLIQKKDKEEIKALFLSIEEVNLFYEELLKSYKKAVEEGSYHVAFSLLRANYDILTLEEIISKYVPSSMNRAYLFQDMKSYFSKEMAIVGLDYQEALYVHKATKTDLTSVRFCYGVKYFNTLKFFEEALALSDISVAQNLYASAYLTKDIFMGVLCAVAKENKNDVFKIFSEGRDLFLENQIQLVSSWISDK